MPHPDPLAVFQYAALMSGLVDMAAWNEAVQAVAEADPRWAKEPTKIAEKLLQRGALTAEQVRQMRAGQGLTEYQTQQLLAGRVKLHLGPYVITDWIAQGGMGQVFKAVHTVMGRDSAVKVLPLEKSTPQSRESFRREIRMQAGLDCPYLVRAYDAGHDGNVHYLVTEYVPGTDLRRLVRQQGALGMNEAAGVIRQAALGLDYAHTQGLIHRDVKPGNILVTPQGRAKVSDIGLATWIDRDTDSGPGQVVGTADYLSPEQIRGPRVLEPTSDIYSLGCTLYYAVTGKVPYPGGEAREKCRRHLEETPWHPRRFAPELAEEFVELIAEMMEKDPRRRIDSAATVAERLLPWCDGHLASAQLPPLPTPWTPAPPPADSGPEGRGEPSLAASAGDEQRSGAEASGSISAGGSMPAPPPVPGLPEPPPSPGRTDLLVIALALAIAIPISLFLGAVIGFIVRGKL